MVFFSLSWASRMVTTFEYSIIWFIFFTSSSSSAICRSAAESIAAFSAIWAASMSEGGTSSLRLASSSSIMVLRASAFACRCAAAPCAAAFAFFTFASSDIAMSFMRCSSDSVTKVLESPMSDIVLACCVRLIIDAIARAAPLREGLEGDERTRNDWCATTTRMRKFSSTVPWA